MEEYRLIRVDAPDPHAGEACDAHESEKNYTWPSPCQTQHPSDQDAVDVGFAQSSRNRESTYE